MVTMVSGIPRYPVMPNAQTTPTITTPSARRRQRTLNRMIRINAMITTAIAPSVSMPPVR